MSIPFKKYGYELNPITNEYKMPQIFLVNKRLQKTGELFPVENLKITVNEINQADEISFSYYRKTNENESPFFSELDDLSVILVEDYGYFEISVDKNENTSIIKNVSGISLGHAELSQILTTLEVNTDDDSARTDYDENYPTVFYRNPDTVLDEPTKKKYRESSLLHRVLSCAPHYKIGDVSPSLRQIQRMFSWNDTDIISIFNDISQEINCVFDIQIYRSDDGKPCRIINVYDLQYCDRCYENLDDSQRTSSNTYKYRTIVNGVCKNCGLSDRIHDIGRDTSIFISTENLSDDIAIHGEKDSIKNCFKITGGDDMITAAVQGLNMSASNKIMMFSEKQKQSMSKDLVTKLNQYDAEYQENIGDYEKLLETEYNIIDIKHYLRSSKMPLLEKEIITTDMALFRVIQKIKEYYNNKFYISSYEKYDYISTRTSIQNMFTTFMPEGYSFTVDYSGITEKTKKYDQTKGYHWYGTIRIYSTGNRDDNYTLHLQQDKQTYITQGKKTSETYQFDDPSMQSIINDFSIRFYFANQSQKEYIDYIEQHTKYMLSKADLTYENEKKRPWNLYSYHRLESFYSGYQSCIESLEEMKRSEASTSETSKILDGMITSYKSIQSSIQNQMNVLLDQIFALCSYHGEYDSDFLDSDGNVSYTLQYYKDLPTIYSHMINQSYTGGYQNETYTVNEFIGTKPFQCKKCGSSNVSVSTNGNICNNPGCNSSGSDIYTYLDIMKNICDSYNRHKSDTITDMREAYRNRFDMSNYLDDELYAELRSLIREDVYQNENYTSDGLNNSQMIERAKELRAKAEQELAKACMTQYTIDVPISSIVGQKSFIYHGVLVNDDYSDFKINNFVRVRIDNEIYKMRIATIGLTFPITDKIDVTFTNVTNNKTGSLSDIKDIINKAENMSTSYSYIASQAENGNNANNNFNSLLEEGLDAALISVNGGRDHDIVIDEHGILLRRKDTETGIYSPCQMKLIDRNLVMTTDNWDTADLAIGLGMYNNAPLYGVWAKLLRGDLIAGENLIISNTDENGDYTVKIDKEGIDITNGSIKMKHKNGCSVTIDPNESCIFSISNPNKQIMYVDAQGNGHFDGVINASDGSFVGTVTAKDILASKGNIGGWIINKKSLHSGDYNDNYLQLDSSSKAIISKNGEDKVTITSGRIQFLINSTPYTTIRTTYWNGTSIYGVGINSEEESKFISFGNKSSSSDNSYITPLVLNYGLNPDGDTQDILIYGTTKVAGEINFDSNIKLNNGSYFCSASSGGAYFSSNIFTSGGVYPGNAYDPDYKLYVNGNSYFNGTVSLSQDNLTPSWNINLGFSNASPDGTSCNAASVYWTKETFESKSSDERVKEKFCVLPNNIDTIFDSFDVRQYEYKSGLGRKGKYFGETSQHIEKILSDNGYNPENYAMVGMRNIDYDSGEHKYIDENDQFHYIDNSNIIWICVDQIQKLKKRVKSLEKELATKINS